jgi:hypothetical protein
VDIFHSETRTEVTNLKTEMRTRNFTRAIPSSVGFAALPRLRRTRTSVHQNATSDAERLGVVTGKRCRVLRKEKTGQLTQLRLSNTFYE